MNSPVGLAAYATPVNAPAALLNKTKRLRKVHFVFADTNSHECNTPINDKTLYTRWAPSVTCKGCRELMVARGITALVNWMAIIRGMQEFQENRLRQLINNAIDPLGYSNK